MNRIEVNVSTGERKVVALTPKEIAEIQARPEPAPRPVDKRDAAIDAALAYVAAQADAPQAVKDYAEVRK